MRRQPGLYEARSNFNRIGACAAALLLFCLSRPIFAQEITVLYTGDTHAMVYHCNCPVEPDGGIARRASLVKALRKKYPKALLLDAGSFFAGGVMDENTQNAELDKQRSLVNLRAMELMRYDAVNLGMDEFNFGWDFLYENIKKTKLAFLSCNLKSEAVVPYVIKEVSGIKVGIIGLTSPAALSKAAGLKFLEPRFALRNTIKVLKETKGADIIIVLSRLGETEDLGLSEEVEGIDILIAGYTGKKEEAVKKIGSTFLLRSFWEGRRLDRVTFILKDKKIRDYKHEQIRLSDKINNDPAVSSFLPACFSDENCKKEGSNGACRNPGSLSSKCVFKVSPKVNLLVITPKSCSVCNTDTIIKYLKIQFPGIVVSYLYYPEKKAQGLVAALGAKGLPVYLLGKEASGEKNFENVRQNTEEKSNYYMLKPDFAGFSFFPNRKTIKGKLDLFFSIYDKDIALILDYLKEFKPELHFLAVSIGDRFDAARGKIEVEEYLRGVCVKKYYPELFWNYVRCRANSTDSSWWEDCLGNSDSQKIKTCARAEEGKVLLNENIGLNKELQIMFGPAYLLDNVEIFATKGMPTKEELNKIIKNNKKR